MGAEPENYGAEQFLKQTEGWPESFRHLKEAIALSGPYDGILGFSQVIPLLIPSLPS